MIATLMLPARLPACPGDDCTDCDDPVCEGENQFSIVNGNARRAITDLQLLGAATGGFFWVRYHNTMPRPGMAAYGVAGNWRHSWQYDLIETTGPQPQLELIYPLGLRSVFNPTAGGGWSSVSKIQESITATANGYDISTPDGTQMHFVRKTGTNGSRYEMPTLTDTNGLVTRLDYDAEGCLTQVTEPAGRFFKPTYSTVSFQKGVWHRLGAITTAPAAGQWLEIAVPSDLAQTPFQHVRLCGALGSAIAIAEIQFYAPGASTPLRGTANGTGSVPAALFDGDTTTVFRGDRTDSNVCGLELGATRKSAVARIRLLAAKGEENTLTGAIIEGLEMVPTTRPQVSRITASDGRTVNYDYTVLADPVSGQEFIALKDARYGDGTQATYRYGFVSANARPLLVEADDPRYEGQAKQIRYTYHDRLGMIHQEINPATGSVYASLELDKQDPLKRVVSYSDLRQVTVRLTSDAVHVAARTDSLGRTMQFERDTFGRVTAQIDYQGRRTERTYDASGNVAVEQRAGRTERQIARDAKSHIVQATDRYGRTIKSERDANGRVTREIQPDGTAREFSYDELGRITQQRDRDGALHKFVYDARGLKTAWTDPIGQTYRYTYDASDRVATVTDPLGRTTTNSYNDRNLVTKTVLPDGTARQSTYDNYGRMVMETDPLGRVAELGYDSLGRVARYKDFIGGVTTYDYTELPKSCGSCTLSAHPSRIVAADGTVTAFLYDTEGRLLARAAAQGTAEQATTTYAYDSDDNLIFVIDPLSKITRHTYDDEHHRLTATDPLGRVTKWTYDDRGNVTSVTSPDGAVTKSTYDVNDRRLSSTDANGATTKFNYDEADRITALTDARGSTYRFTYDTAGRKTAMIYPDDSREIWTYDSAGQPATYTTRADQVKTVSYDAAGRVVSEKWSPVGVAPDVRYTYDAQGRITTMSNGISTLRYTYDSVSRVASETTDLAVLLPGATSSTVGYAYDVMGRRAQLVYPDGTVVKQIYNARGLLASVATADQAALGTWTYDANGHVAAVARANGVGTTYAYDDAGQLTEVAHKKGTEALALARYTIDAAGRRTAQTREDGITEKYGYDAAFNYKNGSVSRQLAQVAPDGIDVFFDNVGGDHLEAALHAFKTRGRAALCGAIASYNDTAATPGPRNMSNIVTRGLTLKGFTLPSYNHLLPEFTEHMTAWLTAGDIAYDETVINGIDNAVDAFLGMMRGENIGKMLVRMNTA